MAGVTYVRLACSRLSVVGSEKRESERKNEGGLRRLSPPSFFFLARFRLSPTTENLGHSADEPQEGRSTMKKTAVPCCAPALSVVVMLVSRNAFHVVSALEFTVFRSYFGSVYRMRSQFNSHSPARPAEI